MHAERTALEAARSLNEADLHALNERTAALAGEAGRLAELSREAEAAAARTRAEQQKLLDERKALDHERCRWRDERDAQVQAELGRQQAAARAESERDRAAIEKQRKGVIAADQDRARQVLAQLIPVIAPSRDVDNLPRRLKPLPNLPYPPVLVEVQCGSFLPGGAARGADPATLLHLGYRFAIGEFPSPGWSGSAIKTSYASLASPRKISRNISRKTPRTCARSSISAGASCTMTCCLG